MGNPLTIRRLGAVALLVTFSLGCQIVSTIGGVKSNANAVATEIGGGREIIGTGEAFVTDIAGSGAVETAQAFVTQEIPSLKETAQAIATRALATPSDVPEDIPIMEGEKNAFVGSARGISYIMDTDFQVVLGFYQSEMPARGWAEIEYGTVVADNQAELHFEKGGRKVIVVIAKIPFTSKTMVVITIED